MILIGCFFEQNRYLLLIRHISYPSYLTDDDWKVLFLKQGQKTFSFFEVKNNKFKP